MGVGLQQRNHPPPNTNGMRRPGVLVSGGGRGAPSTRLDNGGMAGEGGVAPRSGVRLLRPGQEVPGPPRPPPPRLLLPPTSDPEAWPDLSGGARPPPSYQRQVGMDDQGWVLGDDDKIPPATCQCQWLHLWCLFCSPHD